VVLLCTIVTSERDANLEGVNLKYPLLNGANLGGADLSGAKLTGGLRSCQGATKSGCLFPSGCGQGATLPDTFKDFTMPDCPKYEDWLKSKGRGEDG